MNKSLFLKARGYKIYNNMKTKTCNTPLAELKRFGSNVENKSRRVIFIDLILTSKLIPFSPRYRNH